MLDKLSTVVTVYSAYNIYNIVFYVALKCTVYHFLYCALSQWQFFESHYIKNINFKAVPVYDLKGCVVCMLLCKAKIHSWSSGLKTQHANRDQVFFLWFHIRNLRSVRAC